MHVPVCVFVCVVGGGACVPVCLSVCMRMCVCVRVCAGVSVRPRMGCMPMCACEGSSERNRARANRRKRAVHAKTLKDADGREDGGKTIYRANSVWTERPDFSVVKIEKSQKPRFYRKTVH